MTPKDGMISSPYSTKLEQRVVFFLVFAGVLSLTYGLFFVIDFLPQKPVEDAPALVDEEIPETDVVADIPKEIDPLPMRIIFDTLESREVPVLNPASASVSALDTALLSGAVRHPNSADFERVGTIFLFGHSSYLPSVVNKNFQAFNGVQKLVWGDIIRLQSSDTEYVYRVDRVYKVSAADAEVAIESGTPKLTLVTCNSFGSKEDRFVVEATLIESKPRNENTEEKS